MQNTKYYWIFSIWYSSIFIRICSNLLWDRLYSIIIFSKSIK